MSNRRDIQFFYTPHNKPTLLDCSFTVAAADSAGLGITGLNKSGRIQSVYMHTSATPAAGSPNPAAGYIYVILQDNYNAKLAGFSRFTAPNSGSALTSVTNHLIYTITSLGTTTAAQWIAAGVPASITPALGVSFVAIKTGAIGGTGAVQVPATAGSGVDHMELVGNPNVMNAASGQLGGMQLIYACYAAGAVTQPADGTKIELGIYLNNSAQGV